MRSTTLLAHLWRVSILAVALLALPQLASAQLPLETKSLKIQATTGTNAVTLTATGTSGYNMNFPDTLGGVGTFLFTKASGQLAWTATTPSADRTTISWNNTTGNIEWVDPNSANNPNWSRTGNAVGGILGTTAAGQNITFVTGGATLTRMVIEDDGDVLIAADATNGGNVTIGNDNAVNVNGATIALAGATSTTINGVAGETNINTGANSADVGIGNTTTDSLKVRAVNTTITGTSLAITAATTQTGALTLGGTSSALVARNTDGTSSSDGVDGNVLVSAGPGVTPRWKNLNDAIGIRKAGKQSVTNATSVTITGVTGLLPGDAIIVTIEGTIGVTASVFSRNVVPGEIVVRFSGEYSGDLNFMVIKTL